MAIKKLAIELPIYSIYMIKIVGYFINEHPEESMKQVGDKTKYMKMKIAIDLTLTIDSPEKMMDWYFKVKPDIHGDILDTFASLTDKFFTEYGHVCMEIADEDVNEKKVNEGDYLDFCGNFKNIFNIHKVLQASKSFCLQEKLIQSNEWNPPSLFIFYK
jgi:hypothetical protein